MSTLANFTIRQGDDVSLPLALTCKRMARLLAKPCRRLFIAKPMPDLQVPA